MIVNILPGSFLRAVGHVKAAVSGCRTTYFDVDNADYRPVGVAPSIDSEHPRHSQTDGGGELHNASRLHSFVANFYISISIRKVCDTPTAEPLSSFEVSKLACPIHGSRQSASAKCNEVGLLSNRKPFSSTVTDRHVWHRDRLNRGASVSQYAGHGSFTAMPFPSLPPRALVEPRG